ncbi:MAG: NHL repeat-containing protein [Nevskia sp.]|nr:NHL repeat-containing protein [Nevskia sp.]
MKQSIDRLLGARLLSRQAVLGFGMAAAVVAGVAACGGNNNPFCPNLPMADGLIGQSSYSVNPATGTSGTTLAGPTGSVGLYSNSQYMYIADTGNNRVLAFSPVPSGAINSANAQFAIGQATLQGNSGGTATVPNNTYGIGLSSPTKASIGGGGQLVVADRGNNRVLIWNSAPTGASGNQVAPDVVIGQPNATASVSNNNTGFSSSLCPAGTNGKPSQCNVNGPTSAAITSKGQLMVVDKGNSRVMIWNSVPTVSGTPADLEVGEKDFNTVVSGQVDGYNGTTYILQMNSPTDVWTDGSQMLVSDTGNNRVLYWYSLPSTNNDISTAFVYGQTKFASQVSGSGQQGLNGPTGVALSGSNLFIGDTQNNRVLQFLVSQTNGTSAKYVFGQQDFTHTAYNDTDQNGQPGNQQNNQSNTLPAQNVLYNPQGVAVSNDGQQIYVTDNGNSRVMEFLISAGVDGTYTNNCNGVNPQY